MNKHEVFESKRLILKPTTEIDAELIFKLLNSPPWLEYVGDREINSIEDAKRYINLKIIPQLKELGYSSYTVLRKVDNIKIGICTLFDRKGMNGVDIGFALLPEFQRKGYAFEATDKLFDIAFNIFDLKELLATTKMKNIPSQKLLEKLGMKLHSTIIHPQDGKEKLLYKIKR